MRWLLVLGVLVVVGIEVSFQITVDQVYRQQQKAREDKTATEVALCQ